MSFGKRLITSFAPFPASFSPWDEARSARPISRCSLLRHCSVLKSPVGMRRALEASPDGAEPTVKDSPSVVYRLGDGSLGYVGRDAGVGLFGPGYRPGRPRRLGLNVPWIAAQLREAIGESTEKSSAHVLGAALALVDRKEWRDWADAAGWGEKIANGALLLCYCTRKLDPNASTVRELAAELHCWLTTTDGSWESQALTRAHGSFGAPIPEATAEADQAGNVQLRTTPSRGGRASKVSAGTQGRRTPGGGYSARRHLARGGFMRRWSA